VQAPFDDLAKGLIVAFFRTKQSVCVQINRDCFDSHKTVSKARRYHALIPVGVSNAASVLVRAASVQSVRLSGVH
jgi:hypothetical protein